MRRFASVLARVCLLVACVLACSSLPVARASTASTIFNSILSGYDSSLRPGFNTSTPTTIDVQFRVNLLFSVDSKNEQFSLDLFVRELWTDSRLAFDATLWPDSLGSLRVPTSRTVWKPDTFFLNGISCTTSDSLLTLNATGRLNWSRHQTCVFKADFDLSDFPFDSQTFNLKRVSYAYTQSEMVLQPISTSTCFLPDPTVDFENSLWDLNSADCSSSTIVFRVGQDNYYQVTGSLYVERKSQNYIVKLILPMFVIVSLSTITYFIDCSSTPARVGGTVTLVLSIVSFNTVVSTDLPKINYSTLLDWYVWKCFLFVVFAVGEVSTTAFTHTCWSVPGAVRPFYLPHPFSRASSFVCLPSFLCFACFSPFLSSRA